MKEKKANCLVVWRWHDTTSDNFANSLGYIPPPFTQDSYVALISNMKKDLPEGVIPIILNIIWFDEEKA